MRQRERLPNLRQPDDGGNHARYTAIKSVTHKYIRGYLIYGKDTTQRFTETWADDNTLLSHNTRVVFRWFFIQLLPEIKFVSRIRNKGPSLGALRAVEDATAGTLFVDLFHTRRRTTQHPTC